MDKKMCIMAIGAHIGDMELTCGGALTKYAMEGHKVTILHMTAGERGHYALTPEEYKKQKINEARTFANKIGGEAVVLNYKDAELPDNNDVKFEVCDIIREKKPNVIITHWGNSIHKDHATTYKIVKDACFYASLNSFERKLPPHSIQGLFFAENWEDPYEFKPYIYIDISSAYDKWIDALKNCEFVLKSPYFKYFEYYNALSIVRGAESRTERAEAFAVDPFDVKQACEYFPDLPIHF